VKPPGKVDTVELFPELNARLLELLRGLSDAEWASPTICDGWLVKDLAAHLLGDELGNLSRRRDRHIDASMVEQGEDLSNKPDLLRFINRYNQAWVTATRRLSTRVICDWMEIAAKAMHAYFASLNLHAMGAPVSWAGPEPAPVWLDVAREYTERWHHQQQIRDATGRRSLTERRLFAPVLDTFVRALPHTYRGVGAPDGTQVTLRIMGDAGATWWLMRVNSRWQLSVDSTAQNPTRRSSSSRTKPGDCSRRP
jgi:uncharacterized protein (TIGR03083 family)